jgi:hypothetical protein
MTRDEIVLIGPAGAGKTSVGQALGRALDVPFVDLDAVGAAYYAEVDQPLEAFRARIASHGYPNAHRWWQPARLHALTRVLQDHRSCVFALGAGHTHYEDGSFADAAERVLAPMRRVVLLLPSEDPAESVAVLRQRCASSKGHDGIRDGVDFITTWVESAQNARLATTRLCSVAPVDSIASRISRSAPGAPGADAW